MADDIEKVLGSTIQSEPKTSNYSPGPMGIFWMMANTDGMIAPWWSTKREQDLRKFAFESDHLSGAIYTMIAKMTTIPLRIIPRDKSISSHVKIALQYTDMLQNGSQFSDGWSSFYSRWIIDLLTQDNGAFAEVIGDGEKDGPIVGPPIGIAHLDSARCTRTGNAVYPVVYTDISGKFYKLHYSRVMYRSQMPSGRSEMYGVGFCAASRCIGTARTLLDILIYKQEKLGSRAQRQILLTRGGLDPEDVAMAAQMSEQNNSSSGFTRYSKTMVIGNRIIAQPTLDKIELNSAYEGFNEKESISLGMAVIALGLGMDARELFPAMETGASKADAIISHIKQRGKGPGQIISDTESSLNMKFLPPFLTAVFDFQDDSQDRQEAEIRNIRAQGRQRDIQMGTTDIRVEREKMLSSGELTEEQFEYLELNDGRQVDGTPVTNLFFSKDKYMSGLLSGVTATNWESKIEQILTDISESRDVEKIKKSRMAVSAIKYKYGEESMKGQEIDPATGLPIDNAPKVSGVDTSYQSEKFGRKLGRAVVNAPDETQNYQQGSTK
jgi:hypothetical protein